MKKKKKKGNPNKITNHHIIPRSRDKTLVSKLENIARVPTRDHEYYHALFENRRPCEIVECLVNDYWNGDWSYVQKAMDVYGGLK